MAKSKKAETVKIEMKMIEVVTEFFPAIHSLGSLSIKNIDVLMSITKAKRTAKKQVEEYNDLRKSIAEQDCKKDKEGNPIIEDNNYEYPSEKEKIATNNALNDLRQKDVVFELKPVKIGLLRNVDGLTPNMIEALREFIEE